MKKVKIKDLKLKQAKGKKVKGGAAYIKIDDVSGEATTRDKSSTELITYQNTTTK